MSEEKKVIVDGAELEDGERPAAEAGTLLAEEDRSAEREADGERDRRREDERDGRGAQRQRHVERALHAKRSMIAASAGSFTRTSAGERPSISWGKTIQSLPMSLAM